MAILNSLLTYRIAWGLALYYLPAHTSSDGRLSVMRSLVSTVLGLYALSYSGALLKLANPRSLTDAVTQCRFSMEICPSGPQPVQPFFFSFFVKEHRDSSQINYTDWRRQVDAEKLIGRQVRLFSSPSFSPSPAPPPPLSHSLSLLLLNTTGGKQGR